MKKMKLISLYALALLAVFSFTLLKEDNTYPAEHLMDPAELAKSLKNAHAKHPVIINVGSMALIKGAQSVGMCYNEENMGEFKQKVSKLEKSQDIVIYCGCCELKTCPNVKLPYEYLKDNGYNNFKILNLPTGLYEDWTSKGYPMN